MRKLIPALAAGAALCALPPAANAATAFQLGTGKKKTLKGRFNVCG